MIKSNDNKSFFYGYSNGHHVSFCGVKDITMKGCTNHGICFTFSKSSAAKNTCKNNGGLGICCVKSDKVKLSGNKLTGNKKGEIYQGAGK